MPICVDVTRRGWLQATGESTEHCSSYVMMSVTDFNQYQEPVAFNSDLFLYVSGVLLVNMIVGHWSGRVVRLMSKR
ncbi:hypothetical protein PQE20_21500 [Vibrio harveyi]|uniref:hypothetical protein n=1 Tax=Vibrio harveyi TaxID=669 RepID=UPI0002FB65F4|nr:hypothetical protein [Vibrio harveyi]EKO3825931.1 hypothetical protein [Vibrio harveyi]ELI6425904.1 hypothetical protein [Vibrio harveyi]MCG9612544.1 hypothetical protein [Vibrio harveyi]MCG9670948.1 hypothetical protein [Vibrio harveyi]WCP80763.1 hypothetical protein PQE20_01680 [Vibrio harveyi]